MKAELDIKPFLKATNEFGIAEQQPCCVQVVEWVGLVASGLQFLLGLAAMLAEEVGDFGVFASDGPV
jgi:hypothetical protein